VKVGLTTLSEILRRSTPQNDIPILVTPYLVALSPLLVILNKVKNLSLRLRVDSMKNLIILGILFNLFLTPPQLSADEFKRALPGRIFSFPRDHFSHPEFRTEWWYYSGHLQSIREVRKSFGYELTFFRTGLTRETKNQKSKWSIQDLYFAHLALTDESKGRFEYREKISRGSLGEGGALPFSPKGKTFRVWIEDWSAEGGGPGMEDHLLKARDKDFGIELILTPEKNPVIHGQHGISQKAEGEGFASHYYSITRLKTKGKIFLKDREVPVQGLSWMDHEFGSSQLKEFQVGWDWFSIQLENGVDLMFYQIRNQDGKIDPYSSGTIIFPDGKNEFLTLKEVQIEVLENWRSQKSGANYPSKWRLKLPDRSIEFVLSPTVKDQELITKESTRVTYWEGSVEVNGKYQNRPVKGKGYVEMTGYAKPFSKGI
jgi:predicted secreted hydrolase